MTNTADFLDELAKKDPKAAERLRKAEEAAQRAEAEKAAAIRPVRFAELEGKVPPEREFVVEEWVPLRCTTSLYGPGGIGKTMLAQQIATAVAVGRELFGFQVRKGPVLGLMAEDDDDELWRRQIRINEWFACSMGDLGNLHLQGRAGLDNTLAVYPATGAPKVEMLYDLIRQAAAEIRPVLIILDPIAQLYGGNENDRFQVSHFVNLVSGLAREFGCGLLLLGHPAKADGSEYSGSTAWNASVRSRLLLQRKEGEEDELVLSRVKSNYARPDTLPLHWIGGVLRPVLPACMTMADRLEAEERAARARTAFLKALDQLNAQGRNVSHSERAGNFAPKVMLAAGLVDGFKLPELKSALNDLLNDGRVEANRVVRHGPDRHPVHGLARAEVGGSPCS